MLAECLVALEEALTLLYYRSVSMKSELNRLQMRLRDCELYHSNLLGIHLE